MAEEEDNTDDITELLEEKYTNSSGLYVYSCQIQDRGVDALSAFIEAHPAIKNIDIGLNHITSSAKLRTIFHREFRNIHTLKLSGNRVGNDGAAAIAQMLIIPNKVVSLFLTKTGIGAPGITNIGDSMLGNTSLEGLEVDDNPFLKRHSWNVDAKDALAAGVNGCVNLQCLILGKSLKVRLRFCRNLIKSETGTGRTMTDLALCYENDIENEAIKIILDTWRLQSNKDKLMVLRPVMFEYVNRATRVPFAAMYPISPRIKITKAVENVRKLVDIHRRSGAIVPLKRARIVVIGANGAGKTSLVRRLANQPPEKDTTLGMDYSTVELDGGTVCTVYDFSGNSVYKQLTSMFVFSPQTLFLLVVNMDEYEKTQHKEHVQQWVDMVKTFNPASKFVVVGSHYDSEDTRRTKAEMRTLATYIANTMREHEDVLYRRRQTQITELMMSEEQRMAQLIVTKPLPPDHVVPQVPNVHRNGLVSLGPVRDRRGLMKALPAAMHPLDLLRERMVKRPHISENKVFLVSCVWRVQEIPGLENGLDVLKAHLARMMRTTDEVQRAELAELQERGINPYELNEDEGEVVELDLTKSMEIEYVTLSNILQNVVAEKTNHIVSMEELPNLLEHLVGTFLLPQDADFDDEDLMLVNIEPAVSYNTISKFWKDRYELETALAVLHDTGQVLWFQKSASLCDTVFLKTAFVVKAIQDIIRHDMFSGPDAETLSSINSINRETFRSSESLELLKNEFYESGAMDFRLFKHLPRVLELKNLVNGTEQMKEETISKLVYLLHELELLYVIPGDTGDDVIASQQAARRAEREYAVKLMIPFYLENANGIDGDRLSGQTNQFEDIQTLDDNWAGGKVLQCTYLFTNAYPHGLFSRLLVKVQTYLRIDAGHFGPLFFKGHDVNGVEFQVQGYKRYAGVHERRIPGALKILVKNPRGGDLHWNTYNVVIAALDKILATTYKGVLVAAFISTKVQKQGSMQDDIITVSRNAAERGQSAVLYEKEHRGKETPLNCEFEVEGGRYVVPLSRFLPEAAREFQSLEDYLKGKKPAQRMPPIPYRKSRLAIVEAKLKNLLAQLGNVDFYKGRLRNIYVETHVIIARLVRKLCETAGREGIFARGWPQQLEFLNKMEVQDVDIKLLGKMTPVGNLFGRKLDVKPELLEAVVKHGFTLLGLIIRSSMDGFKSICRRRRRVSTLGAVVERISRRIRRGSAVASGMKDD